MSHATNISELQIQIQLDRIPEFNEESLLLDLRLIRLIRSINPEFPEFRVVEGDDNGKNPYVNLVFETPDTSYVWSVIQKQLYENSSIGSLLQNASIVVCTGKDGWNDYKLLYHFDTNMQLDDVEPSLH